LKIHSHKRIKTTCHPFGVNHGNPINQINHSSDNFRNFSKVLNFGKVCQVGFSICGDKDGTPPARCDCSGNPPAKKRDKLRGARSWNGKHGGAAAPRAQKPPQIVPKLYKIHPFKIGL